MAALFKLQYLIIIGVCLHSRSSYGFPHHLPYNGVQIITYGEPCYSSRQLPITIEEPIEECVTKPTTLSKPLYRPLKLNYRTISMESPTSNHQLQKEYPISVQVPEIIESKIKTPVMSDTPYRGKSYKYDIQTPSVPIPSIPITMSYNFDVQVPSPPPPLPATPTPKSIKLLTGLTSKIDKILIPACETSSINKPVKYDVTSC